MANNPSVTLTFAGDSKQVHRAMDDVGDASDRMRDRVGRNSTFISRETESGTERVRKSLGSQQHEYDRTAESYEDMIRRMARAQRQSQALERDKQLLGLPNAIDAKKQAESLGQDSGDSFSTGFSGRVAQMLPRLMSVGTGGAFATAVVPAMGIIGLLAGGALVAGIGAGLTGLGVTVAAKSEPIKVLYTQLATDISNELLRISKPFQRTLIDIERDARQVFGMFGAELEKSFPDVAKQLSEFSDSLVEAFKQLAPVIGPVLFAFREILDDLGPQLPGVFQDIANALIPLAETVANNSDGFANFVVAFLEVIPAAINFITWMINVGTWFVNIVRDMIAWAQDMADWIIGALWSVADFLSGWPSKLADYFRRGRDGALEWIKQMIQDIHDLPGKIIAALGDLGGLLWNAGVRLIGGLIDGIKAKINDVKNTLANLTNMLPSWKGPEDVDSKLLNRSGQLIIGSLVDGFRQEEPDVRAYLGQLTEFIGGFGPDTGRLTEPSGGSSSGGVRESVIRFGSDGSRIGDALLTLVQEAIRERGGDPAVLGV